MTYRGYASRSQTQTPLPAGSMATVPAKAEGATAAGSSVTAAPIVPVAPRNDPDVPDNQDAATLPEAFTSMRRLEAFCPAVTALTACEGPNTPDVLLDAARTCTFVAFLFVNRTIAAP